MGKKITSKKSKNTQSNKRIPISKLVAATVMHKSNLVCCVCKRKGEHIHHLKDKDDNSSDNLALLCFKHHDDATKEKSLSKKLSRETIVLFRDEHYRMVSDAKKQERIRYDQPIKEEDFTEEKLLVACKNAIIIIDLEKLKRKFFRAEWKQREDIIGDLGVYSDQSNHRIADEIFEFLWEIASQTRSGMTFDMACGIFDSVLNFFPGLYHEENREQGIKIAKRAIQIGQDIVYDSFIHLRNISVAMWGLGIIKFIYREAKQNGLEQLKNEVLKTYEELEATLQRAERKDLEDAKQSLGEMKADLDELSLSFPVLSANLMKRIESEKKV